MSLYATLLHLLPNICAFSVHPTCLHLQKRDQYLVASETFLCQWMSPVCLHQCSSSRWTALPIVATTLQVEQLGNISGTIHWSVSFELHCHYWLTILSSPPPTQTSFFLDVRIHFTVSFVFVVKSPALVCIVFSKLIAFLCHTVRPKLYCFLCSSVFTCTIMFEMVSVDWAQLLPISGNQRKSCVSVLPLVESAA